jgi:hypothetical protein
MMMIAKGACEQRQKSLSILTDLYKGNYFAASSRGSACHITAIEHSQDRQRGKIEDNPRMKELAKKKLIKVKK